MTLSCYQMTEIFFGFSLRSWLIFSLQLLKITAVAEIHDFAILAKTAKVSILLFAPSNVVKILCQFCLPIIDDGSNNPKSLLKIQDFAILFIFTVIAKVRHREPSLRGVCAQNLQTRGLKNNDDVTLVIIFCAGHVGIYQINWL